MVPPLSHFRCRFAGNCRSTVCSISTIPKTNPGKEAIPFGGRNYIHKKKGFNCHQMPDWLVVWNILFFFHLLGMSSSQLTFIFFRGVETTNQLKYIFLGEFSLNSFESWPRFAGFSLVFAVLSIVLVVAGRRIFRGSLAPAAASWNGATSSFKDQVRTKIKQQIFHFLKTCKLSEQAKLSRFQDETRLAKPVFLCFS